MAGVPEVTYKIRRFDDELTWVRTVKAKVIHCTPQANKTVMYRAETVPSTQIKVAADSDAGQILAYIIDRQRLKKSPDYFLSYMDMPSQDICDLAKELFDRHGNLKRHHQGTFAGETNQGSLLYIRDVKLEEQYQQQDLGCKALAKLLMRLNQSPDKAQQGRWHFAVMHPEECETSWRPAGFRAIKTSGYLGCCYLKRHRCWDQTASDPVLPTLCEPEDLAQDWPGAEQLQATFNLARAFPAETAEQVSLAAVQTAIQQEVDVAKADALQHAAARGWHQCVNLMLAHGADIDAQDRFGNTALHVAAQLRKIETVKLLLESGADIAVREHRGYTALDACILETKGMREFSSGMFGHFKGYSEDEMTLIKTLCEAGAAEHLIPGVAIPTRKEGCTCGQCIGGWLSPRMSLRLSYTAQVAAEFTWGDIKNDISTWPCTLRELSIVFQSDYMPLHLRQEMTKELLSGWAGTHDLMHNMLEEKIAPTASALTRLGLRQSDKQTHLNGFPSVTRHYFEHGGRAEHVIDAVLEKLREVNEVCGDKSDDYLECKNRSKAFKALPECDNDFDFKLLRQHLCNNGLMPNGPYLESDGEFDDCISVMSGVHLAPADTSDEEDCEEEEEEDYDDEETEGEDE